MNDFVSGFILGLICMGIIVGALATWYANKYPIAMSLDEIKNG